MDYPIENKVNRPGSTGDWEELVEGGRHFRLCRVVPNAFNRVADSFGNGAEGDVQKKLKKMLTQYCSFEKVVMHTV